MANQTRVQLNGIVYNLQHAVKKTPKRLPEGTQETGFLARIIQTGLTVHMFVHCDTLCEIKVRVVTKPVALHFQATTPVKLFQDLWRAGSATHCSHLEVVELLVVGGHVFQ